MYHSTVQYNTVFLVTRMCQILLHDKACSVKIVKMATACALSVGYVCDQQHLISRTCCNSRSRSRLIALISSLKLNAQTYHPAEINKTTVVHKRTIAGLSTWNG